MANDSSKPVSNFAAEEHATGVEQVEDVEVIQEAATQAPQASPNGSPFRQPPAGQSPAGQSPTGNAARKPGPPEPLSSRIRLLCTVLATVALADVTLYRGAGYAGQACLFLIAPALFWLGSRRPASRVGPAIIYVMVAMLGARVFWDGYLLPSIMGFCLLASFTMAVSGRAPFILETISFTLQAGFNGCWCWEEQIRAFRSTRPRANTANLLNYVLPIGAFLLFGLIFLAANPDLFDAFGSGLQQWLRLAQNWMLEVSPQPPEILFWLAAAWMVMGWMRPRVSNPLLPFSDESRAADAQPGPSPFYTPFRNTLATLIALFSVYLIFEFRTLWFREFPDGFYYAGYAHEGAAWLTLALALATLILSLMFRGRLLRDARLVSLRRLAWIWSIQNFILTAAVFNRMGIYIGFNGLTRMRMIGLFGITAVVAGFVLVLVKIAQNRGFVWLVRRQLWALAATVFVFALTPIDVIVVKYNVGAILSGKPAPAVQLIAHPLGSVGASMLVPLLDCGDDQIEQGVRALLAQHEVETQRRMQQRKEAGWTAYQAADSWVLDSLAEDREQWSQLAQDEDQRAAELKAFYDYAYQWY